MEELKKLRNEFNSLKKSYQAMHDEIQIRILADKFSDAANRKDAEMFQSLWAPNGLWAIGPPVNMQCFKLTVLSN